MPLRVPAAPSRLVEEVEAVACCFCVSCLCLQARVHRRALRVLLDADGLGVCCMHSWLPDYSYDCGMQLVRCYSTSLAAVSRCARRLQVGRAESLQHKAMLMHQLYLCGATAPVSRQPRSQSGDDMVGRL